MDGRLGLLPFLARFGSWRVGHNLDVVIRAFLGLLRLWLGFWRARAACFIASGRFDIYRAPIPHLLATVAANAMLRRRIPGTYNAGGDTFRALQKTNENSQH
jgi:hypothetical protein